MNWIIQFQFVLIALRVYAVGWTNDVEDLLLINCYVRNDDGQALHID